METLYNTTEVNVEDKEEVVLEWPIGSRIAIIAFDESLSFFEFSVRMSLCIVGAIACD